MTLCFTDMYAEIILHEHIEKVEDLNLPQTVPANEDGKEKNTFSELEVMNDLASSPGPFPMLHAEKQEEGLIRKVMCSMS